VATKRRERGAAAVEPAIVLPLLLLIIAAVVDLGRAYFTQVILTNAAREGARTAVVTTLPAPEIQARTLAAATEFDPSTLTVTPISYPCVTGLDAGVEVTLEPFKWLFLEDAFSLVGAGGVLPDSLSSRAMMRCS
jgi:uncharacterized membrane protein